MFRKELSSRAPLYASHLSLSSAHVYTVENVCTYALASLFSHQRFPHHQNNWPVFIVSNESFAPTPHFLTELIHDEQNYH